jgi:hypothetical protein
MSRRSLTVKPVMRAGFDHTSSSMPNGRWKIAVLAVFPAAMTVGMAGPANAAVLEWAGVGRVAGAHQSGDWRVSARRRPGRR